MWLKVSSLCWLKRGVSQGGGALHQPKLVDARVHLSTVHRREADTSVFPHRSSRKETQRSLPARHLVTNFQEFLVFSAMKSVSTRVSNDHHKAVPLFRREPVLALKK